MRSRSRRPHFVLGQKWFSSLNRHATFFSPKITIYNLLQSNYMRKKGDDDLTEILLKMALNNNKTDIHNLTEILLTVALNNKTDIDDLMKYCGVK
jgi:hypothetical protein